LDVGVDYRAVGRGLGRGLVGFAVGSSVARP